MTNSNGKDSIGRTELARLLAAVEDHNRLGAELAQAVKRISSLPPPPAAAAAMLEPTRQDKVLAIIAEAEKEGRGVPTTEIAQKLGGLNRQQIQTAIQPLEKAGLIVTTKPRYQKTESGYRRGHCDVIYPASVLDGWK